MTAIAPKYSMGGVAEHRPATNAMPSDLPSSRLFHDSRDDVACVFAWITGAMGSPPGTDTCAACGTGERIAIIAAAGTATRPTTIWMTGTTGLVAAEFTSRATGIMRSR